MADIALLVTEEFERKLKRGAPGEEGAAAESRRNFGAVIKVCSSWVDAAAAAAAAGVTVNVALLNVDPKSGPAVAAMDGAFSA
ncbi:uncharacterized protein [Oryza sativa Japonica Group]|uniref:Os03g0172100 protein n=3 Tax=Oryza sativa TaxID=4530 RepID=A0A8J8Y4G6_ORYSJ|nr:uncharacterized protein LOC4331781 [Oryza sativa Japonica Group]ACY26057.1 leucine zipper protein [Oryza sativa]AAB39321.2 leucine zipper protein [Oryza sativa Japonica Group]ABF94226.1 expressed protein [Oryza sativa Japonica Group]EAZ25755.1 hypothetical protein OsJ_09595 [Oryza sativa Japonica Group]KAF2937536.1 hypothetical protein DAI22_03g056800 [Oryza sativa Japonica Group]|eukprot:NP_001049117.1 Os03g0172100 [Oryza sativa Japonica Group]